jgi:acetoin utilization protein AcuB
MFAIYNVQGRRFHDTLENLRKVRETQASIGMHSQFSTTLDDALPVYGKLTDKEDKVITSKNALTAYREIRHLKEREPVYQAHQLMSHPATTIRTDMDILEARLFFQEKGVNQMPVMDAQHSIIGMLSIENLLQFIIVDGDKIQYLKGKTVADAMSMEVITADPVSDIRRIAQAMQEYRLHAVPIVDERDVLIGIVSRSDILRALTNDPPLNIWS